MSLWHDIVSDFKKINSFINIWNKLLIKGGKSFGSVVDLDNADDNANENQDETNIEQDNSTTQSNENIGELEKLLGIVELNNNNNDIDSDLGVGAKVKLLSKQNSILSQRKNINLLLILQTYNIFCNFILIVEDLLNEMYSILDRRRKDVLENSPTIVSGVIIFRKFTIITITIINVGF
jgi:hypothetical protein